MANRFDEALDTCMNLIMRGVAVEECLARYPDEADELRPHLLAFASFADLASLQVSPAAKARGRERLRAELASLEQRDEQRAATPPWPGWFRGWRPAFPVQRWTVAAAAVLLLILGGTGTVAASRGTIPGDTFYPVKIVTERARLAFVIAEQDKASLHVSFAERRAREISALLERGENDQAVATAERLASHLESAGRLSSDASPDVKSELQARLEDGSSRALAALQVSLSASDGPKLETTFNTAGNAYARAIESLSGTDARPVAIVQERGSIQLRASDPPPPGVDQVLATVLRVEAFLPSGPERGWATIIEGPITFDLKQASKLPRFLGEREVTPGTYTRLRLHLGDATVLAGGVSHQASLAATSIELPRPFRVDPRKTTVVVLDFDGMDTVRVNPGGQFVFTPDVRVLAHEPGVRPVEPEGRAARPAAPAAALTAAAQAAIPTVAEVVGEVEAVGEGSITVNGKKIELELKKSEDLPAIEKGANVRIEVQTDEHGNFRARQIEVTPPARPGQKPDEKKDDKGAKDEQAATPTPAPVATPTPETPAEFSGLVGVIEGDRWIVAGRKVLVTNQTRLSAEPAVGAMARVIGVLGTDGVIRASVIIIEPAPARPADPTATPIPRPTPETRVTPERPKPEAQAAAAPVAEITGTLNSISGTIWDVGGKRVRVPPSTPVLGVPIIGAEVRVIGGLQPDGSILAVTVEIRIRVDLPQGPAQTPVPPTPTPSSRSDTVPPLPPSPRQDAPTPAATSPSRKDEDAPGRRKQDESPGGGQQELPSVVPLPGGRSTAPTREPRLPEPPPAPTPTNPPEPTSTASPTPEPPAVPTEVLITGRITRVQPLEIDADDGRKVISGGAQVIGAPSLNARVTIQGRPLPNGAVDATVITVH